MKRSLDIALRYGVAALAVGVALLVKLLLDPLTVQDTPFLLVFSAIIVSAWRYCQMLWIDPRSRGDLLLAFGFASLDQLSVLELRTGSYQCHQVMSV